MENSSSDLKILLVEDNENDELLALRALKKAKVANEVIVRRDGEAALDFLFGREQGTGAWARDNLAVVMLDLKLPKINGLEVLDEIRKRPETKRLPVVMLTSSDDEDDLLHSYDSGANSFVRKPVEFNEFSDAISRVGLYWCLLNKPPLSYD